VQFTAPANHGLGDPLRRSAAKSRSPYPYAPTSNNIEAGFVVNGNEDVIQPYIARMASPVKVTYRYTPAELQKAKSLVYDQSRQAVYNYRPARRKDHPGLVSRFRAPQATLTSLHDLSPWLSVTKADYRDPRWDYDMSGTEEETLIKPYEFRRSYTDADIRLNSSKVSVQKVLSREGSFKSLKGSERRSNIALYEENLDPQKLTRAKPLSREQSFSRVTESAASRSTTSQQNTVHSSTSDANVASPIASSKSSDKRVTIVEPEKSKLAEFKADMPSSVVRVACNQKDEMKKQGLKSTTNESIVNYYSGYLPPELSEEIATQLKLGGNTQSGEEAVPSYTAPLQKPLVGDRSCFLRNTYPVHPRILRTDIDQMRLEGRKRLLQSFGHVPAHFSVLSDKKFLNKPKVSRFDENARNQQRQQAAANDTSGVPAPAQNPRRAGKSSMEMFQLQRERTYNLQNLARQMLKD